MTEAKFTPGPWRAEDADFTAEGAFITCDSRDGMMEISIVPDAYLDGQDNEFEVEQVANAHLIAAAPEMYAMLRKAIQTGEAFLSADDLPDEEDRATMQSNFNECIIEAEKLLAKARGEA